MDELDRTAILLRQQDALVFHLRNHHRVQSLITIFDLPELSERHSELHDNGDTHLDGLHSDLPPGSC